MRDNLTILLGAISVGCLVLWALAWIADRDGYEPVDAADDRTGRGAA